MTTLGHAAGRGQRQVGGVDGIGHGCRNRRLVSHQIFVIAAAHRGNRVGDWRMTSQRVIRRSRYRSARGLANADGDCLPVRQGHHNRRTRYWSADSCGVSNSATLSRRFGRGQFDGGGVDGIGNVGDGRNGAWHQVLEVTASCSRNGRFDFARVLVDVIGRRRDGHSTECFASINGDHGTVRQGHRHWRASSVGQRRGVGDLTTLGHAAGRSQRQVGGVDGVGHGGADRGFVSYEVFVVAAGYVGDRVGDRRVASQCIVRRSRYRSARGLADTDGDGLTVSQGHYNRRTGYWRADSCGVSNSAAFSRRFGRSEFDGGGVDGIGNVGDGRNGAWHQVFEVATGGVADRCLHGTGVSVDVIGWRRNGHGTGGFARFDGDYRAVAQSHGDWRTSSVGQGRGVGDLATLGHAAGRGQRQVGGVGGVSYGCADRGFVGYEVFVVAASYVGDRVGDWRMTSQHIIRRSRCRGASGLADADGDGLAVSQGHDNRRTRYWSTDSCGVSDSATLSRRFCRGEFDGRGVDGVSNVGHGWCGAWHQVLEVTASRFLNGDFDFASVFVNVIGWRWNGHGAGSFTRFDSDYRAVAQSHGHWRTGSVGQGRGIGDLATLGHGTGSRQRKVGGVDRIGYRSHGRRFVRHQIFVIAAAGAVNLHAQGVATGECIVRRSEVDAAAAGADRNGDGLAVGQGHDNRGAGDRRGQGRGVNHHATFNGARRGGQRNGAVVDGVGNVGDGRGLVDHQVLEVAAGGRGDARVDFAGVLVHVIVGSCDGGGAGSRAFGDVDHRAVAQGHGHGRAGCIGQCGGVDDRAALGDRTGRAQADIGGVDGVGHGGADRGFVSDQIFVVAAGHVGDRVGQRCMAGQYVVRCSSGRGACGLAHGNGDALAVGQSHHDR